MLRKLTVTGSAEVVGKADQFEVGLTITELALRAKLAQESVARKSQQVMEALLGLGLQREEIQTASYWVESEYEYENKRRRFKGYRAKTRLQVRTGQLEDAGKIVDALVEAGAEVDYVHYRCRDEAPLYYAALEKAAGDARRRAEAMARGLGVELGRVLRVSDRAEDEPGRRYATALAEARGFSATGAETALTPREVRATAEVTAVFELGEGEGERRGGPGGYK
ncbi:MAG: SIMPL domain-containing protein [Bacillota bacterium]|nr:SIMPL domain-containing protein [Bacillota bacterium]